MSSRAASRSASKRGSFDENDTMVEESKDKVTGTKCVQSGSQKEADSDQIENNPGLFAAEQTWPTEEEMNQARKRKLSGNEEGMQEMDTGELDIGSF